MTIRMLDRESLHSWTEALIARGRVVGVQARGDHFVFDELTRASDLRLDYDTTILPPKKYFLPQEEALLRFEGDSYQSVLELEPFVLLGVHPYDMVAINQMDTLFAQGVPDKHYLARREAATIVVVDMENSSEHCFAGSMGTAVVKDGFDALLTRVGEHYVLDARTAKGRELLAFISDAPVADRAARLGRVRVWERNRRSMNNYELMVNPADLPELLSHAYDDALWEERAELCFSCGACNLVCPTCYCFDVQDVLNIDTASGVRQRVWDSCQLKVFAEVAGGENFREHRASRLRHRVFRKAKFVQERTGRLGCVGCGRCSTHCVAKISILEVLQQIADEATETVA